MAIDWTPVIAQVVTRTIDEKGVYSKHWNTIKATVGRKSVSYEERKGLAHALEARGIAVSPPLDGTPPKGTQFITMVNARSVPAADVIFFPLELSYEDLIAKTMPNFPGLQGVAFAGRQVKAGSLRIDLLGRKTVSRGRTRWYVIEVEREKVGESVAQVMAYGAAFRELGARSKTIGKKDGVIEAVTPQPDDEVTLVVIAQGGRPKDKHESLATQLHRAAKDEGFHSKWIVTTLTASEVVPTASE